MWVFLRQDFTFGLSILWTQEGLEKLNKTTLAEFFLYRLKEY